MEYLIQCPECEITDLSLNDKNTGKNKKPTAESYHCNACDTDFSVERVCSESKNDLERNWKKIAVAAIILI